MQHTADLLAPQRPASAQASFLFDQSPLPAMCQDAQQQASLQAPPSSLPARKPRVAVAAAASEHRPANEHTHLINPAARLGTSASAARKAHQRQAAQHLLAQQLAQRAALQNLGHAHLSGPAARLRTSSAQAG